MAVAPGTHVYRGGVFTVEATNCANQITAATVTVDTPQTVIRTADPLGTITDYDNSVYAFEVTFLQNSAMYDLIAEAEVGEELEVVMQVVTGAGQQKLTFTILAKPIGFGGEVGSALTLTETFAISGTPVRSTSV